MRFGGGNLHLSVNISTKTQVNQSSDEIDIGPLKWTEKQEKQSGSAAHEQPAIICGTFNPPRKIQKSPNLVVMILTYQRTSS